MKTNHRNTRYLNLYFQVHQPRRLKTFRFFDIGSDTTYFDDELNKEILLRVARVCYLPANLLLLKLISKHPQVKVTFSISGTALEQFARYAPEVLESFQDLASTGSVEFLAETYYHSLASVNDPKEFVIQVKKHTHTVQNLLGITPAVFRNTELIYTDQTGRIIESLGYKGMFIDGPERILGKGSPHYVYNHADGNGLKLLLRNYRLSDDISFRFSQKKWNEWPLTAAKYTTWLDRIPEDDALVNLAMDYETFGEHQKPGSGIFVFLEQVVNTLVARKKYRMVTASEALEVTKSFERLSSPNPVSWADRERDLSAWLGNEMQRDAFDSLNRLGSFLKKSGDPELLTTWRFLQTSDHFYYMSTKKEDDGNVHAYFSPYPSPYEAFMNYMNVLADLEFKINRHVSSMSNNVVEAV